MSNIWSKVKTPVIALLIIVVLFFAYNRFFGQSSVSTSSLTSDGQTASSTDSTTPEEKQFLALLLKVQRITIDAKIFNDPVFTSLQDDGLPILDQPQGRSNPFAAIGSDDSMSNVVEPVSTPTVTPTTTPAVTPKKK